MSEPERPKDVPEEMPRGVEIPTRGWLDEKLDRAVRFAEEFRDE